MKLFILILISLAVLNGASYDQAISQVQDQLASFEYKVKDWQADSKNEPKKEEIPTTTNLKVDFASQAPHANWDLPYQEACEEAALIQAYYYFNNKKLTNELMDQEIIEVVEWEKQRFGLYSDTELAEVGIMAKEYFNLDVEIVEQVTIELMKQYLSQGYLILAPTAGRELGNPNYTEPGPLYHFLVIRGYDRNEFITNDVGTRKGDGYKYKYQTIINAIHDLPLKENGQPFRPYDETAEDLEKEQKILKGAKRFMVVRGILDR